MDTSYARYYQQKAQKSAAERDAQVARAAVAAHAQRTAGVGALVHQPQNPADFTATFVPTSAKNETARYYELRAARRRAVGAGAAPAQPSIGSAVAAGVAGLLGK